MNTVECSLSFNDIIFQCLQFWPWLPKVIFLSNFQELIRCFKGIEFWILRDCRALVCP